MPQLPYNPIATGGQPGSTNQGFQRIDGVGAAAFGATQGQALQSFGQEFSKTMGVLADIEIAKQRETAESDVVRMSNDFFQQQETLLTERQRTTTGDAAGFTQNYMQEFNRSRERLLGTISDPVRRNAIDARLAPSVRQFATRAFQSELQLRDTFEGSQLDQRGGQELNALQQSGGADFAARRDRMIERVQASSLPETDKAARIASINSSFATAAAMGIMQNNPAALAGAMGGTTPYFQELARRESSNNPRAMAGTSSATGLYQFIDSTWNGLANSEAGRAAGLRPIPAGGSRGANDPRFDEAQQQAAVRLFTQQNEAALRRAGFDTNSQNLYLAHFMGAGGAVTFLRSMQASPNAPAAQANEAAANANPTIFYNRDGSARTNAEVFQRLTGSFANAPAGGSVNPEIIRNIPPNQFAQIRDRAEREAARQTQQAVVQQNNQRYSEENQILVQLNSGQIGRAALEAAQERGLFTDINRIQQFERIAAQQETAAQNFNVYQALVASGGQGSGNVAEHKTAAEAAFGVYTQRGLNPFQATQQIVAETGVVPASGVTAIMTGLNSNDVRVQREAYNAGERILFAGNRPDTMQGITGGAALRDEILAIKAVRDTFGTNSAQADQEMSRIIQERRSPDWGNRFQARQAILKPEVDRINQEPAKVISDINAALQMGFFGRIGQTIAPINPTTESVLLREYQTALTRGIELTGNIDSAKKWAQSHLATQWGYSADPSGTQRLMQFPVERTFPRNDTAPDEPFGYVYRVAQDQLSRQGINVPTSQIYFNPTADTARQVREGVPPSYVIYYKTEVNGITRFDRAPGLFTQDPNEVLAAGRALRVQEEQRARQTTTPGASRTSTPIGGRSAQAAEQDRIRQEEQMRRSELIPMRGGVEQMVPVE